MVHAGQRTERPDATIDGLLKRLFPGASRIAPKEGAPPHFKVFGKSAGPGGETLIGFGFWTTELEPLERGYDGPIKILVGMDLRGVLAGVVVVQHHEPLREYFGRSAGLSCPVCRQERSRSVQGRPGHRRGVAGLDYHPQRYPSDQEQRPEDGDALSHTAIAIAQGRSQAVPGELSPLLQKFIWIPNLMIRGSRIDVGLPIG